MLIQYTRLVHVHVLCIGYNKTSHQYHSLEMFFGDIFDFYVSFNNILEISPKCYLSNKDNL